MGAFLAALPRVAMAVGRVASFALGRGTGRDAGTDKDPAIFSGTDAQMKTVY